MATTKSVDKNKLCQLSLLELSQAYRTFQCTPTELCTQLIKQIEKYNPILNAYVYVNPDLMQQAQASTLRWQRGEPLSDFDGVPIGVKDNLNVAQMPTSWGNAALRDSLLDHSESCIEQCQQAGMLVIGKTNIPEFASEGFTDNPSFGPTRNPWDTDLTPGGSSGGMVSAIASGMASGGIGTDGGGSIRRPCAHTGLIGLKPTAELISRQGGLPRFMFDFEVAGPIGRTVDDVAALFSVMSNTAYQPNATQPHSLRVLVVNQIGQHPVEPEIVAANQNVAHRLTVLGHVVCESSFPIELDFFERFWQVLGHVSIAYIFDCFPHTESVSQEKFQDMANMGRHYSATDMMAFWQQVLLFRQEVKALFQQWDLIVMPSIAALAWPVGQTHPTEIAGQAVAGRGHAVFTGWVNAAGNPALNIPVKVPSSDQPIGIQLIADWYQEQVLFDVASQVQANAVGWNWPAMITMGMDDYGY